MDRATKFILIALLTFTLFAAAQTASAPPSYDGPRATVPVARTLNSAPSELIRILAPAVSQKLENGTGTVRFELTNPAIAPGRPDFLVQMDGRPPIRTSQTQQVFTGLSAGAHTVTVELVDVSGAPIRGGHDAVQFFVAPPAQSATKTPTGTSNAAGTKRELKIAGHKFEQPDPAMLNQEESNLPPASSPLPLISVIGFGVLVGGIISAMKTRS